MFSDQQVDANRANVVRKKIPRKCEEGRDFSRQTEVMISPLSMASGSGTTWVPTSTFGHPVRSAFSSPLTIDAGPHHSFSAHVAYLPSFHSRVSDSIVLRD